MYCCYPDIELGYCGGPGDILNLRSRLIDARRFLVTKDQALTTENTIETKILGHLGIRHARIHIQALDILDRFGRLQVFVNGTAQCARTDSMDNFN